MGESILVPTVNNVTNNKINITNNISPSSSSPPPMAPNQNNAVALRCPRCDSSNTKFCYYNNYSLTQPRHFCKACKRYWTRGGTLRNVPVGGGCRKNKRHKRSAPASVAATAVSADPAKSSSLFSALAANNNNSSENLNLNSFLFGLPSAVASTSGMNQYVSYDLQPQLSTLGIGGSDNNQFQLGFGTGLQQSGTFLNDDYSSLLPYQDLQASASENFRLQREVKIETGSNVTEPWQIPYPYAMNPLEALAGSGDYSYPYWNSAAVGSAGWPDVKNSSIAQLF